MTFRHLGSRRSIPQWLPHEEKDWESLLPRIEEGSARHSLALGLALASVPLGFYATHRIGRK